MSEAAACVKQNELGPDYCGYFKHLVLELFSQHEDIELDSEMTAVSYSEGEVDGIHNNYKNGKASRCCGSLPFFSEGISGGLSASEKERLKLILDESVIVLNQEADEILDLVLAKFQIETELREKELLSCYSSASDEDMSLPRPPHMRKRKKSSFSSGHAGPLRSQSFRQVCNDIQALQGSGNICHKGVEMYSNGLHEKLEKMEQDLKEYLNVIASKCRRMTQAEKQRLGRQIQKLPEKALDRIVDIIHIQNSSGKHIPDNVHVNLEILDDVTLWRLYYYVETVAKANKL